MRYLNTLLSLVFILALVGSPAGNASAQQKKKKPKEHTTAPLDGTYWRLYEMNGKLVETPADAREVYIKLTNKKSVLEGFAGCNLITGTYTLGKETLTFDAATTERACDDMTTENYMMQALTNTDRYTINGLNLLLYKGTFLLAVFEAKFYDE